MQKSKANVAKQQEIIKKSNSYKDEENKLSYYNIGRHKAVLIIYALLCLVLSVAVFVIALRLIFGLFGLIPILSIGQSGNDLSYLADFLGGFIGIIVGFLADAMFISRLQHLKRYRSLLNILNKELNGVKNTLKYVWGINDLLYKNKKENKTLKIFNDAGFLDENDNLKPLDIINEIFKLLEFYNTDKHHKNFYDKLFENLKAIFTDAEDIENIQKRLNSLNNDNKVLLYKLRDYFTTHNNDNYDFDIIIKSLSLCITLNSRRMAKISTPTLHSIVTSTESIATFYNLPRYTIWSEEQGNFAKELQDLLFALNNLEENFKAKKPWEFLLICKKLIDRIDKFQKITDLSYYQENVFDYLEEFLCDLRHRGISEDKLIENLKSFSYLGLTVKKIKKLKPHNAIDKNYFRYKIVFKYANNLKSRDKFLLDAQNRKIFRKTILRFEKLKYENSDLLYLLNTKNNIYDSQEALYSTYLNEERNSQVLSDFAFSSKFFSLGFKKLISDEINIDLTIGSADRCFAKLERDSKIIDESIKILSDIFRDITTIIPRRYGEAVITKTEGKITILDKEQEFIGRAINKIIKKSYEKKSDHGETILKLISPIGSYKNRLLQSIYVKTKILYTDKPIFYIDISKYENEFDINELDADLVAILKILESYKASEQDQVPLFIIDNIREFQCGINHIYDYLTKFLKNDVKIFKLIIGCDALYTLNINQEKDIPFFYNKHVTTLSISSMNLSRIESIDFIANCLKLYDGNGDRSRAIQIQKELIKLYFYLLDAYWLIKVLEKTDLLKKNSDNILKLYDIGLLKYTVEMSKKQYDALAQSVFMFEYEGQHFDYAELRNNNWKLAREHRSMIDYLVARHFVLLLREVILARDVYSIIQIIGGKLNLLLPKNINRFVIKELSSNDIHNLIIFCKRNMEIINQYPKFECQITYILRQLGKNCLTGSIEVLKLMLNNLPLNNSVKAPEAEERQMLFLRRCITIGLGYLEDSDEFNLYLKSIVNVIDNKFYNSISDDINRAFHLDYYGDTIKCLDLNGNFDGYSDDITKGVNALRKLQIDIKDKIAIYNNLDNGDKVILILQMVTYCSLMKARNYEFSSLNIQENFIEPIISNIESLREKINEADFTDKWFNAKNSYLSTFFLQTFTEVYAKVKK